MGFLLEIGFLRETNWNGLCLQRTFELRYNNMEKKMVEKNDGCVHRLMAIRDAMDILSGKWKISIIASLSLRGKMRFMDVLREVDGIAAKMLSKELTSLETNLLIKRTVMDTKPITVEYELTAHGHTLNKIIKEIGDWGVLHREKIIGQ